jgi:hypothetical protein
VKKKQWKKLEDTRKDDDLKAFMEKGINGVAFSRTQLQTKKFKQWKDSVQSKAFRSFDHSLKNDDLSTAAEVKTSFMTTTLYKHVIKCEPNALILESEDGSAHFEKLRAATLSLINVV